MHSLPTNISTAYDATDTERDAPQFRLLFSRSQLPSDTEAGSHGVDEVDVGVVEDDAVVGDGVDAIGERVSGDTGADVGVVVGDGVMRVTGDGVTCVVVGDGVTDDVIGDGVTGVVIGDGVTGDDVDGDEVSSVSSSVAT